jgi:two-component system, NtrC family, response regulator GlrR
VFRASDDRTRSVARPLQRELVGAMVRVLNSPAVPAEFKLTQGSCRIGGGSEADLVVADPTVSRLHAELTLVPEGVVVTDLQSRNGTFYLGQRLERVTLALGSQFRIGGTEIALDVDRQGLESSPSAEITSYGDLIGVSEPMRRLFALLVRLEASLATVLIHGESGTGKELVARALHEHSPVGAGPFVPVNCGALERSLVRSELFGHKKGSFTGAISSREGAFEVADNGTLFLDEVSELPFEVQPVLLRALELGTIVRVGEARERKVKVRVVAATNRELMADVDAGRFRKDLYYRLAVVKLTIPPLRERPLDVEALARHYAEELGMAEVPSELLADFRGRSFPGNVRELRNAVHAHAAIGFAGNPSEVGLSELEAALRRGVDVTRPYAEQKEAFLKLFQRRYVELLLEHTKGNQSEAARISGLERSYLNKILSKLGT